MFESTKLKFLLLNRRKELIEPKKVLENDCDEQMVKDKFKKAEETTDQKFHGVSRRLSIVERNYGFTIRKNC